jgi:hypothetical protein
MKQVKTIWPVGAEADGCVGMVVTVGAAVAVGITVDVGDSPSRVVVGVIVAMVTTGDGAPERNRKPGLTPKKKIVRKKRAMQQSRRTQPAPATIATTNGSSRSLPPVCLSIG